MAAASSQVSARFCYMFASPLVRKTNGQFIPIARPLNLEREQTDLINKLKDSGKRVAWEQHVTSHETFASALPAKIDVLHYSGHGEPGELCGEDSLGVLTEITVKQVGDFLRLLQQRGPLPLVFVSACHSFNIGSVFMQAGCKCFCYLTNSVHALGHRTIAAHCLQVQLPTSFASTRRIKLWM